MQLKLMLLIAEIFYFCDKKSEQTKPIVVSEFWLKTLEWHKTRKIANSKTKVCPDSIFINLLCRKQCSLIRCQCQDSGNLMDWTPWLNDWMTRLVTYAKTWLHIFVWNRSHNNSIILWLCCVQTAYSSEHNQSVRTKQLDDWVSENLMACHEWSGILPRR